MAHRRDVIRIGIGAAALATGSGLVVADEGSETAVVELFGAGRLLGANEVPPVDSPGDGAAVFAVVEDGDGLHYTLLARNAERVTQAHVHLGGPDENGSVVLFLFGQENEDGDFASALGQGVTENGVLASRTLTADHLVGPLAGAGSLDPLLEALRAGGAYVNVHTEGNPAGEVRGQVRPVETVEVEFEEEVSVEGGDSLVEVDVETDLEIEEDGDVVGGAPDEDDDGDEVLSVEVVCTADGATLLIENESDGVVEVRDIDDAGQDVLTGRFRLAPGEPRTIAGVGDGPVVIGAFDPETGEELGERVEVTVDCSEDDEDDEKG